MRLLAATILILMFYPATAQNLPVGKRSITYVDATRANRNITTELYYPATAAGTNTPLATGTEKYPVIVFGHGFVMPPSAYLWLADSLVKYGFLVAFPSTESSFSPSHEQFGRDLAFLAQRLPTLNDSSGNFLFGRVANKVAVGGHSMGGGCSFLAMTYNTQIQAVFNVAAAETNPSAKAAASGVQKPALLFSGSQDCIVAPSEQQTMYNNIPYPCKTYINITGGLHCQFGNNDGTCTLGQISSGCNNSPINVGIVFEKTISLLRPFLQHYLKADCSAANGFETAYTSLTGATKLRTCTSDPLGCVISALPTDPNRQSFRISPNPALPQQPIRLTLASGFFRHVNIFDAGGRLILSTNINRSPQLDLIVPTSGIFLLQGQTSVGIFYQRVIVHNN